MLHNRGLAKGRDLPGMDSPVVVFEAEIVIDESRQVDRPVPEQEYKDKSQTGGAKYQ